MRSALCTLLTAGTLLFTGAQLLAADHPGPKLEHPSNVALVEGAKPGDLVYKHFPTNLRLYVFDKDGPGKSNCNEPCTAAWPPLLVPQGDARNVGDWKPFKRDDGRLQWAYKGHPVYVRYHDSPDMPMGDGIDGAWHFLTP